jgi:menaquinone-specific isochorismate synthase
VGWIGREAAEFAVAIRSALMRGNSLDIFAGAGIVRGSEPEREWDEVRSKMGLFLEAFGLDSMSALDNFGEGMKSIGNP